MRFQRLSAGPLCDQEDAETLIPTLFYGSVIGLVVGLIWTLALSTRFSVGLTIGFLAGFIVALVLSFFGKLARSGSNLQRGETSFVSSGILTFLGIAAAATGLIVWLVRAVF